MEPHTVAAVLSSMARRTIETAEPIASALDVALLPPTCDLCEMHPGEAEGLTDAEMRAKFGFTMREVPGGEHYPDWLSRATDVLHRIAATWAGRTVICVTHSGVLRASFVAFGKMPHDEAAVTQAANTSITEWSCGLDPEPGRRPGVWRLDRYNDAAHLD
jgi:probable phosphoglycerate mutase